MLSRALLPLSRPLRCHPPIRIVASPQLRHYAKNKKARSPADYALPSSAAKSAWERSPQQNQFPSTGFPGRAENVRETSDSVSADQPESNISFPDWDKSPHNSDSPPSQISTTPKVEHEGDQSTDAQEVAAESQPRRPLPDLTRGIPSTLDAELQEARSRHEASSASLNITEDPSEPTPSAAGKGGDGIPRNPYVSSGEQKKNTLIKYTYLVLAGGIIGYTMYLGRNWDSEEEEKKHSATPSGWGISLFYNRVKARLTSTLDYYNEPAFTKLLPDEEKDPNLRFPFTLVLELEDLLVHQEWTRESGWRIAKRPGVDYFLRYLSQYYELVLFTTQPSGVADQIVRKLDPFGVIRWPLFREATLYQDGGYVKDLSYLNRDLKKVLIIDTNAHHVKNQPENAILIPKWTGDPADQTLVQLIPFLEYVASMGFDDARAVLKSFEGKFIPAEFARREKLLREKFEAQEAEKRKGRPKRKFDGIGSLFGAKQQPADTADEAAGEAKMVWDQIRERGQKQYEFFEKQIREEGPKWLAEAAAAEKKFQEEAMKNMQTGFLGYFSFGGGEKK